jgi:hypothetical protein
MLAGKHEAERAMAYTHRQIMESLIRNYREHITTLQEQLAPLEAGTSRMGESREGGPWVDVTVKHIELLKDGVHQYEMAIEDLEGSINA